MADPQSSNSETAPLSLDTGRAALGKIVVFICGRGCEAHGILELAGVLAHEHAARLIGVFIQPQPPLTKAQEFARGKGIREVIDLHQEELQEFEAGHRVVFDDITRRHGIQSEWKSLSHFSSEVGKYAYVADLVIVARPGAAAQATSPPGLAESLVLSSGRPIILFPPHGAVSQVRRILVAWNAKRESVRAFEDALPLLARATAIEVLVVDRQRHPLQGLETGVDIARQLSHNGASVEVKHVPADGQDIGRLMLSQAAAFRADLLVMGAYGHSQVREWVFGSVTRTVLYEAAVPVLMSR